MRLVALALWLAVLPGIACAQVGLPWPGPGTPATTGPGAIAPNAVASSTLAVWLKADAGCLNGSAAACANGDTVATWQDQSGNGRNATKCAAGPTYVTNSFANGKPAIQFYGPNQWCMTTAYAGTAGTVIVVYYDILSPGQRYSVLISGAPQAGTSITAYDIMAETPLVSSGSFSVRQFDYGTTNSSIGYSYYTNVETQRIVWSIAGMTNDGTTLNAYEQNVLLASATIPGGATVYTASGQVIGAGDYGGTIGVGPSYFSGLIAEIITYTGKISSSDYAGVVLYLQQKYGIGPASGNYIMLANNRAAGEYTDLNLYVLQGPDGASWPYSLPANFVPTLLTGQTATGTLAPQVLKDMQGSLVKYNGRYWASISRCVYPGLTFPCVETDVISSSDFQPGVSGGHWTLATCSGGSCGPHGNLNMDTLGATDGTTSTRGGYNDNFIVDAGNSNAIYLQFDASNNAQNSKGFQEYAVPITLNATGSYSIGSLVTFAGTCFPFGSTGSAVQSGWFTAAQPILVGGTYTTFLGDLVGLNIVKYCKSTSLFSGYNGTIGSLAATSGTQIEWPTWVQTGGNGTIYWDSSSGTLRAAAATDGALGTVSGLNGYVPQTFQPAIPGTPGSGFVPQSASVAKLPAVVLP